MNIPQNVLKTQKYQSSFEWLQNNCDISTIELEEYTILKRNYKNRTLFVSEDNTDYCSFSIVDYNDNIENPMVNIIYDHLFMINKPCLYIKGFIQGKEMDVLTLNQLYDESKNKSADRSNNFVYHIFNVFGIPPIIYDTKLPKYSFKIEKDSEEMRKYQNLYSYNQQRKEGKKVIKSNITPIKPL